MAKRTALYYPLLFNPSAEWIKHSLLYWDHIATVVSKDYWEKDPFVCFKGSHLSKDEVDLLVEEKIYRPIFPEDVLNRSNTNFIQNFEEDYVSRLSAVFKQTGGGYFSTCPQKHVTGWIYSNWLVNCCFKDTRAFQDLVRCVADSGDGHWSDRETVITMMSVLSDYIAIQDSLFTTPVTDDKIYRDFSYLSTPAESCAHCIEISIENIFPTPCATTPILDIIDFKDEYNSELLKLQTELDQRYEKISQSSGKRELKENIDELTSYAVMGYGELMSDLHDHDLLTLTGCTKTLLEMKTPDIISTLVGLAGYASSSPECQALSLGGLALSACLKVGTYYVDSRIEKYHKIRKSPFGYIYYVNKEFS